MHTVEAVHAYVHMEYVVWSLGVAKQTYDCSICDLYIKCFEAKLCHFIADILMVARTPKC